MSDIIKKQVEAYQGNFIKHKDSPLGTFQNDNVTQEERFAQLLKPLLELKPEGFSICDIGSGVCDMHKYLTHLGIPHTYTGVEIVPEMVAHSQALYPNIEVLNADFLSPDFNRRFDFVVLSGTFNIPGAVNETEWQSFIFSMVSKMFASADLGISFNALTTYSTFRADELFYLSPEKVMEHIQKNLSRFCTINSAYPLYEFSYSVFTKEAMKNKFSHNAFAKYFKN